MRTFGRTPTEYLATLLPERGHALSTVRDLLLRSMMPGFEERLSETAIYYDVPPSDGPRSTSKPLVYAGLASQKHYMTLYLRPLYYDPDFRDLFVSRWRASGRTPDLCKSCVRFRTIDDVDLDTLGDFVGMYTPAAWVATWQAFRGR